MADGSDGPDVSPETAAGGEIWGTLEELLLACAVSRHGTGSWDSVAMEVQTRSPLAARPRLTPGSCRLRFHQLHRRFSVGGGEEEAEAEAEAEVEGEGQGEEPDASAADGWLDELRRLRVAELRREVQRCDLSIGTLQTRVEQMKEERERSLSGEAKPEGVTGDDNLSSEEPGRSCRESNSTDLKRPKHSGDQSVKEEAAKQEASGESMAASKESSDVRSSASLYRRRKAGAADEEPEESQPLAALLDRLAARFGYVFERVQENQESDAYRGTIRRHVDLEIMRRKLDRSSAGGSVFCYPRPEFYRDLLLLCANAAVFLPRHGPDHAAAADALALVSAQVSASLRETKREVVAAITAAAASGGPPAVDSRRADAGVDIVGSLIEKTGKPLIFCRKRSSIAKASAAVVRKEESGEKGEAVEEEESDGGKKAVVAAIKDKAWGLRTKKSRGPGKNSASGGAALNRKPTKATDDAAAKKADKKKGDGAAPGGLAKKRNAVDFLKRLNQGSSPSKKRASPLARRKRSAAAAASPEQQKTRKGPGRKDTGRGGSKKGAKTSATKRSVGRPLKRAAAPTTPPPSKRAKVNRSERSSSSSRRGGRK